MSADYITRNGEKFNDLKLLTIEENGGKLQVHRSPKLPADSGEWDDVTSCDEYTPEHCYLITDGTNYVHVDFDHNGEVMSATRYGSNKEDSLLILLGSMSYVG